MSELARWLAHRDACLRALPVDESADREVDALLAARLATRRPTKIRRLARKRRP